MISRRYLWPCLLPFVMLKPALAIEIWHSDTVWANQGMCSATFTLDSGTEPVGELDIGIELVNARQEVVSVDHLTVAPFGTSEATRYQTTYAEGEHYCDDTLSIRITSLAEVDSGVHKRLPLSLITPRHFRPFTIVTAPRDK